MKTVRHFRVPLLGRYAVVRDDEGQAETDGRLFLMSHLQAVHQRDGEVLSNFDLGSGVVTTAGVRLMANDWNTATAALKLAKYHDCGTGTTAPAIGDTTLVTPYGGSRATGTQSGGGTDNIYVTTGTISFTGTLAITEWGLFTATSAGTLWDRRTFTAINVVNGDSILFTYSLTINAGG